MRAGSEAVPGRPSSTRQSTRSPSRSGLTRHLTALYLKGSATLPTSVHEMMALTPTPSYAYTTGFSCRECTYYTINCLKLSKARAEEPPQWPASIACTDPGPLRRRLPAGLGKWCYPVVLNRSKRWPNNPTSCRAGCRGASPAGIQARV
jgi:hypothetical protein